MRLKLQNIGIIEEATIDIDGITLIAGQNDSGKSTVGKVLYALIRGVNIDENGFNYSKNEDISDTITSILKLIYRTRAENDNDKIIQEEFITNFREKPNSFFSGQKFILINNKVFNFNNLELELDELEKLYIDFTNESVKNQLKNHITHIKSRILLEINDKKVLKYELEKFFKLDFGNQIKGNFLDLKPSIKIEGINESEILFGEEIEIINIEKNNLFYDDIIFIESPLLLEQKVFHLRNEKFYNRNVYLNSKIHKEARIKDIFNDDSAKINSFLDEIRNLINGEFAFNSSERIIFNKKNTDFDLINVATGIKVFGTLQLLLQKGEINSNSLLVIDEPEVHLHPTWQVKFAEILVKLSKELNIQMVLTSHSPYFIEAIEAYSKKYKYEDSTNFYFAKKNEDGLSAKITDVTKNISPILSSISEAFYTIQDLNYED